MSLLLLATIPTIVFADLQSGSQLINSQGDNIYSGNEIAYMQGVSEVAPFQIVSRYDCDHGKKISTYMVMLPHQFAVTRAHQIHNIENTQVIPTNRLGRNADNFCSINRFIIIKTIYYYQNPVDWSKQKLIFST